MRAQPGGPAVAVAVLEEAPEVGWDGAGAAAELDGDAVFVFDDDLDDRVARDPLCGLVRDGDGFGAGVEVRARRGGAFRQRGGGDVDDDGGPVGGAVLVEVAGQRVDQHVGAALRVGVPRVT